MTIGILNSTRTTLGRSLMRSWFLRPSLSLDVINARLDAVECFLRPENIVVSNSMHSHLQGIRNVPRILTAIRAGKARASEWQGVVKVRERCVVFVYFANDLFRQLTFHSAMLRDCLTELNAYNGVPIILTVIGHAPSW